MKKSHVFLTPASADKAGEVREIEYDEGPPQFAEPVSYAANDALGNLRHAVTQARAALRHARSKKASAAEIAKLEKAFEAAKQAAGQAHYAQKQQREQQRTGSDFGAPDPFSRQFAEDKRQFAEVVDYSVNDSDTDSSGATFDDEADDELEVAIRKAVEQLEQAQAAGGDPAKMEKLAAALKVLRDQLPNPSAPPADTSVAPPHMNRDRRDGGDTGAIRAPFPGAQPISSGPGSRQSAPIPGSTPNPKPTGRRKPGSEKGWDKHLADLDKRLAARALAAAYPSPTGASSPTAVTHARNADVCCEGRYKCARCKAKAAAA